MKIVLHGLAPDNAGNAREAGTELVVSEDLKAGHIGKARAAELIERQSASEVPMAEKTAS